MLNEIQDDEDNNDAIFRLEGPGNLQVLHLLHYEDCMATYRNSSAYFVRSSHCQGGSQRSSVSGNLLTPKPVFATPKHKNAFIIPENYNPHQAPPLHNGDEPLSIQFSILVFGIFDVNELAGDISLEANLKIFWRDTRLANLTREKEGTEVVRPSSQYIVVNPSLVTQIWTPDIFIDHMKSSSEPSLISKAASLRLYPDGAISTTIYLQNIYESTNNFKFEPTGSLRYSARTLINLSCRMDFVFYPADTQKCSLDLKSYAYSNQTLTLAWKNNLGPEMAYPLDLHNFDVALETGPDYIQTTRSASYSAISFSLYLRRKLSYHIIQTFIPSSLFTIVSWLSFLVPPESTPGRMALTVTTLLTLTAMFSSVRQNVPSVSYVKGLDFWMLGCIVFVFISLAEYTIYLKLRSMKEERKRRKESMTSTQQTMHRRRRSGRISSTSSTAPLNWSNNNSLVMDFRDSTVAAPLLLNKSNNGSSTGCGSSTCPTSSPRINDTTIADANTDLAAMLEKYTPRILPIAFVIFNFIFWPCLLIKSDYYNLRHSKEMYYSL
ncbi:Gamma-aminobutyric acid receptor subunit rho-2 [Folsomia candida]|uniref:Gamma-aminobutyric acid receptor subunit rho-2 n=1 Tax=Folsomia candida TaxID=158441 RepID=A0A226EVA2_FOLCA|nr:Gamma-aminobutyric acid receptor subunit rho-2 [Folsomia candida]